MCRALSILYYKCTMLYKQGMLSVFVFLEIILPSCPIFTLVTEILYSFMDRLFMSFQTALSCGLIITLVTLVLYTFMDRFFMCLKMALFCCLIPAVLTGIHNTFMFTAGVLSQTSPSFITCLTFLTLVL